ncbi:MAG: DUF1566 domain-containing protein [Bacteroidales bacterium]|nr:DUF1566 domain-containing protein [Bacteroidales bacterium]
MFLNLKYITNRILILIILLLISCSNENEEVFNGIFSKNGSLATILTIPATSVTDTSAEAGGNLTDNGSTYIIARGICWSTDQNPDTSDFKIEAGKETGEFVCSITRLSKGTIYYMRAYVSNNIGTAYGNQESFTTLNIPTITTSPVISITDSSAMVGGEITADGGTPVLFRGICWNRLQNPTLADSLFLAQGSGTGIYSRLLNKLLPNTTYYVRAYATNRVGTAYGNELTFTTTSPTLLLPTLTTTTISAITQTTAVSGGNITSDGGATVTARGVCWSSFPNPTIALTTISSDGNGSGSFTSSITGLTPATLYYVRAYATNSAGTAYGGEVTFTTSSGATTIPSLNTETVTSITQTSAKSGGNIISNGGGTITSSGVCWSTSAFPTIALSTKTVDVPAAGLIMSSLTGLTPNTLYYVRAYATNSIGTGYGNQISFATLSSGSSTVTDIDGYVYNTVVIGTQTWMKENLRTTRFRNGATIANLTDGAAWIVTDSSAYCWYNNDIVNKNPFGALYNFSTVVDGRYLCPSGWHVPTDAEWTILTDYLGGENLAGGKLKEAGTTHWVSPNTGADNSTGFTGLPAGVRTDYGAFIESGTFGSFWSVNENSPSSTAAWRRFFTSTESGFIRQTEGKIDGMSVRCLQGEGPVYALVKSVTTTVLSSTSGLSGGIIISDGGSSIIARGVCWSTSQKPVVALPTVTSDGAGTGTFSSTITGLSPSTKYYVRAYATNSLGTSYGPEMSFTTNPAGPSLPTITTNAVSEILDRSAKSGGNLVSDGGDPIVATGVCWSINPNPTIINNKTTGILGVFTSLLTGLVQGTTYYVRAYATNSVGTGYGNEVSFKTLDIASIVTSGLSAVTQTSATCGGNVINDGGAPVTGRGLCWNTTPNPTIMNSKTSDGTGSGIFVSSLTGLTSGTTYYVRSYATNFVGTAYGNEISFTTLPLVGSTVTDIDGNVYNTITIGTQTWLKENLKTTKFRDGTAIAYGSDPATWNAYSNLNTAAYCWYNDDLNNKNIYGALYNFHSVIDGHKLCPTGWHVPANAEWTVLENYIGGSSFGGGKLKESGTAHWLTPNTGATDEYGYSALPGGYRSSTGGFTGIGNGGYYWSSTENPVSICYGRYLSYMSVLIETAPAAGPRGTGFSVRCLQGEPAPLAIGDCYQGGIVAYIFQSGDPGFVSGETHGLIAAPSDQSTSAEWGCVGISISGADSTGLGRGNQNTIDILNGCATAGTAAKICSDLVLNGYNDWYLPSRDELNKLYLSKEKIGAFTLNFYWSSSEFGIGHSWYQHFFNGTQGNVNKDNLANVRAIRSF